jgi:hypothetical protein
MKPSFLRSILRTAILPAIFCTGFLVCAGFSPATDLDDSNERTKLYNEPDPASPGGIRGRITKPDKPLLQVLAIPPDAPRMVYQAEITGPEKRAFQFQGLPMRRYDLIVVFDDSFFEGCQLARGESSLTDEDHAKIAAVIEKTEPFFTKKIIHRAEGETGRGNWSRALCTFAREDKSITYLDPANAEKSGSGLWRRTFKLVELKDVGPGWQIANARDLYPVWADPAKPHPTHHFDKSLSRVRVADTIKDLGDLVLGGADVAGNR